MQECYCRGGGAGRGAGAERVAHSHWHFAVLLASKPNQIVRNRPHFTWRPHSSCKVYGTRLPGFCFCFFLFLFICCSLVCLHIPMIYCLSRIRFVHRARQSDQVGADHHHHHHIITLHNPAHTHTHRLCRLWVSSYLCVCLVLLLSLSPPCLPIYLDKFMSFWYLSHSRSVSIIITLMSGLAH